MAVFGSLRYIQIQANLQLQTNVNSRPACSTIVRQHFAGKVHASRQQAKLNQRGFSIQAGHGNAYRSGRVSIWRGQRSTDIQTTGISVKNGTGHQNSSSACYFAFGKPPSQTKTLARTQRTVRKHWFSDPSPAQARAHSERLNA